MRPTRRSLLAAAAVLPATGMPAFSYEDGVDPALGIRDLLSRSGTVSDLAPRLDGQTVTLAGYMAPPLSDALDFFVLTSRPMVSCPFCDAGATWPRDNVAIYTRRLMRPVPYNVRIAVQGVLSLSPAPTPGVGPRSRAELQMARVRTI